MIQAVANVTGVNVTITRTKVYFPIVALSINNNIRFLVNLEQGFKRAMASNK